MNTIVDTGTAPRRAAALPLVHVAALVLAAVLALLLAACGGHDHANRVPAITTQPLDASVVVGSSATFSVVATGAAPLAYQWSSSSDGGVSFVAIAGATATSYSTGPTSLAQSGLRLRVSVSNEHGNVPSSTATLTVTSGVVAPAITVQPADVAVTAPATATFHVTATGTTPSYAWQQSADGTTWTAVPAAADAPRLDVADTSTAMSGRRYRVIVSNAAGAATSAAARLTVDATPAAPLFTTQPASRSIAAGMGVDFVVAATGTPSPAIRWRANGTNLVDGAAVSGACAATVAGATTPTLSLAAVPVGCSGIGFDAVASNGIAPDAASIVATLTVMAAPAAPVVITQPADATVTAGASAAFTSAASGTPTPSAQWQLSSDGGTTWANIGGATASTYATPATTVADDGHRYRAVFANASGSVNSASARLTVLPSGTGVSLLAGGIGGYGNLDGVGSAARFSYPYGIAVDTTGAAYVTDGGNCAIRRVAADGSTSTVAGGSCFTGPIDGTGRSAGFGSPSGMALDAAGNAYFMDGGYPALLRMTPAGVVTTFAGDRMGGFTDGTGAAASFAPSAKAVAVDAAGNVYVADTGNNSVRRVTPAGVVSTYGLPSIFNEPNGIAVDAGGAVYVADTENGAIRRFPPNATATSAPTVFAGVIGDRAYVDGPAGTARLAGPRGLAFDGSGNLYVTDVHAIRRITPAGYVTTVAGEGFVAGAVDGSATTARFNLPTALAVDGSGRVLVTDNQNSLVRRIDAMGNVSTLAGLASDYQLGPVDGVGSAAHFSQPRGIAYDTAGNLYVADASDQVVRKVTPSGIVSTVAGSGSQGSADGNGRAASFNQPSDIAIDGSGNLFVVDLGNHAIRKITPAGVVSTFAGSAGQAGFVNGNGSVARFNAPAAITIDAAGTLYVADYGNSALRKISPTGAVGTLSFVGVGTPFGIALDAMGNVWSTDVSNNRVMRTTPAGSSATMAGSVIACGHADGIGPAASFCSPAVIVAAPDGSMLVGDFGNGTVRRVDAVGSVTTVLGVAGEIGNRLGANARFTGPIGLAFVPGTRRLSIVTGDAIVQVDLP